MKSNDKTTVHGGVGFFGLLGIVFITLKLLNLISWSWLWVLSPLWMPVAIIVIVLLVALIISAATK